MTSVEFLHENGTTETGTIVEGSKSSTGCIIKLSHSSAQKLGKEVVAVLNRNILFEDSLWD